MIYKDHPKRNSIITWIVIGIGLLIIFFAILPLLNIQSVLIKGLVIVLAILLASCPAIKHLYKKYKDSTFEERHGRRLK